MKTYRVVLSSATLAFFAGSFLSPAALKAAVPDSPEITSLLTEAKAEAVELKADAGDMESFTRSTASWQTYGTQLSSIRDHINKTGKLLARLKSAESSGAPWQQTAIKRIEPLLKEMADNTTTTIKYLNDNPGKVHLPEFRDYVRANYELATDLDALIGDFVKFGSAEDKYKDLGSKLEVSR
jgi:acyl-CoA reductase-like NAD-dependent aldehyde dehydrogenase